MSGLPEPRGGACVCGEGQACSAETCRGYPGRPVGRSFDPDWTPKLALAVAVWLAAWSVGFYFFWTWVAG